MKKKSFSFLAKVMMVLLIVPHLVGFNSFGYNKSNVAHAAEERIVIATYTLTKAQTKDLATNMKMIKNTSNLKILIYGVATKFGGVAGWASVIAAQLSSNSTYKQVVINAANQGKRVKITVTDNKYYHTSYSTQLSYKIVK